MEPYTTPATWLHVVQLDRELGYGRVVFRVAAILATLFERPDFDGFVSVDYFVRQMAPTDKRAIRRAIAKLEARGWIERDVGHGRLRGGVRDPKTGRFPGRATVYRLTFNKGVNPPTDSPGIRGSLDPPKGLRGLSQDFTYEIGGVNSPDKGAASPPSIPETEPLTPSAMAEDQHEQRSSPEHVSTVLRELKAKTRPRRRT